MKTRRLIVLTFLALCLPVGSIADDSLNFGRGGRSSALVVASDGAMFSGTFNRSVSRKVAGIWAGDLSSNAVTIQPAIKSGKSLLDNPISSGDTRSETLPVAEPGTLVLVGTGLLGLAGSVRGKSKL